MDAKDLFERSLALYGVSALFLLTPIHPHQVQQAANVIDAASESGNDPPQFIREVSRRAQGPILPRTVPYG